MKKYIYFTKHKNMWDLSLRQQLVRIPEVLAELKAFESHHGVDVVNPFSTAITLDHFSADTCVMMMKSVQLGLLQRLRRVHPDFDEKSWVKPDRSAATEYAHSRFPFLKEAQVYVIGPGHDEVSSVWIKKGYQCFESITCDPALSWFWSEIQQGKIVAS